MIAALVDGSPVTVEQVERRVRRLRAGPRGPLLPADLTTEGRQLRRWVVQVLVTERVVAAEAAARGVTPGGEPPLLLDGTARLELGSVTAAVLAADPLAQALYRHLTADVTVGPDEVRAYYAANPDRYARRPARLVTHRHHGRPVNGGRPYLLSAGELTGRLDEELFTAPEGATIGPVDGHTLVVGPAATGATRASGEGFRHAAPAIRAELLEARRRRRFALWAGARCAAATLMPGFEHPGDISHSDHTHRH